MFLISGNNHLVCLFICFSGSQLLMPFLLAACHQHKSWSIMGLGTETGALVDVRPWLHFQLSLCYFVIVQYKHSTLYVWSREGILSFIVCMRCIFFGPCHSKLYLQLQLQSHLHSLCNFPVNLLTTCIPWNRITLDLEPCYLLFWRAKRSWPRWTWTLNFVI